jgi:hypothetical protein
MQDLREEMRYLRLKNVREGALHSVSHDERQVRINKQQ